MQLAQKRKSAQQCGDVCVCDVYMCIELEKYAGNGIKVFCCAKEQSSLDINLSLWFQTVFQEHF